jgi:putative ABC transport system substrate-binding protein
MSFDHLKRRDFITLLAGATASVGCPLVTWAQQAEIRRIGVLISATEDDLQMQSQISAFHQGLRELGWVEGRNVHIDARFPANDPDRLRSFAAELVGLRPDVLLASGPTTVLALQRVAGAAPIVFTQVNDPVGAGIVATLAHPGGNVTGFTPAEFSIGGKLLEVLKELAPGTAQVGVLLDTGLTDQTGMWSAMEMAAPIAGVRVQQLGAPEGPAIERAIAAFASGSNGGLIVLANRTTIAYRKLIIELAAKYRLPSIYSYRYFADDGGLASYGADLTGLYRRAASYVDRILKGEKPADLPVQQPTQYEFVINLKTAKALGLTVPATLLARADEVIE